MNRPARTECDVRFRQYCHNLPTHTLMSWLDSDASELRSTYRVRNRMKQPYPRARQLGSRIRAYVIELHARGWAGASFELV